jgi:hypothetical protein
MSLILQEISLRKQKIFQTAKLFHIEHVCLPYTYPVKLTIADLIRAKSICSQTQFSHIINSLLTSLVRSVLLNIRPQFFALTSLLRRSVHTENLGLIFHSSYRPHAQSNESITFNIKRRRFSLNTLRTELRNPWLGDISCSKMHAKGINKRGNTATSIFWMQ